MNLVPPVLRPCVSYCFISILWVTVLNSVAARFLFTYVPKVVKRALSHVGPTIEERLLKEKELGPNWQGKPVGLRQTSSSCILVYTTKNDLISWLIEKAPPELRTVRGVTVRLLTLNFAALHSTSMVGSA